MRGHIRKRGKNSWQIAIYRGRDPDGKRLYDYVTVRGTKRQAEQRLTELVRGLDTGEYVEPSQETLGEYLSRWFKVVKPSLAYKTVGNYSLAIRHLTQSLGPIRLDRLSAIQIQAAYQELAPHPHTAAYAHRVLRRALNQAVKWGLLVRNPALLVDAPRTPKREMQTWTAEQARRFLDVARSNRLYSLYLTIMTTGMREGELLGLRWSDVDLDRGEFTIRQSLVRGGKDPIFKPPKTESGYRVVPIPPVVKDALVSYRKAEIERRLALGPIYSDHGLVWPSEVGTPIVARNLVRQFKSLIEKANKENENAGENEKAKLPDIRFYDLRHTHATLLLESGIHPKVVQERLGHSSIRVTMDTYSHVMPHMQKEASESIEKSLFGNSG